MASETARLSEEMKEMIGTALEDRNFCLIGSADAEGWPNVSYRGSVAVLDDEHMSFWNRSRTGTVRNVEENPRVVIFFRSSQKRLILRFYGLASIAEGADRDRVMAVTPQPELDADPERVGIGVIVKLTRILDGRGEQVSP